MTLLFRFNIAYYIVQMSVPLSSKRYLKANFMIIDKNGRAVDLDTLIEVNGRKYTVIDIDGNFIVATPINNGVKRRFSISDLGMTNTQDGDDDESNDTEKIDQDTDQKANVATVKNHETLVEKVQAYSQRAEKLGVSANELQAAGSVVGQFGIDDQLVQLILDDEKGPLITIYLSQNLAELEKLIQMPIIAATTHIATVIKAKAGLVPLK